MNYNLTTSMHRYRIELITASDIQEFVAIASKCEGKIMLRCSESFCINAKSLLGVMLASRMQWNDLLLLTEYDHYTDFEKFIVL